MQAGIQNEKKFAEYLDGKTFDDLSDNFKLLILALYGNVEHDTKIECWQSKYYEKADIKIRINGVIKGLSLKTGFNCSVHQETKFSFIEFLELIGLSSTNINFFDKFLMGEVDGKRVKALIYINTLCIRFEVMV